MGNALVVELFITFQLVFTVFATCDHKRHDLKGSSALAIGLSVCVGHLFAVSIPTLVQLFQYTCVMHVLVSCKDTK